MREKQGIYNIEKQEANRDIINIAGDYIIQHPITHEPVHIPSIQSVLRKTETSEGNFFKKEPEWVDYEHGFIVKRKEVDEIIKKLENNKIQLVLGAPASGKSVILKNVGFKLANENKKCHVIELKKHPMGEVRLFFENIPKISDENAIFIVDDAHLYFAECERLIKDFRGRGKGNLIIGSRETEEITRRDPTQASEFEYLSKIAVIVKAEDVTEEMIQTFLKTKHNLSDERIKFVSGSLEKFKKDLWNLSWALKAYKTDKDMVEEDTIYEIIKERIKIIKAEEVFLPLSIFYRYEIPIERKFLEKQLGIKKETIEQLIGLSEIVETEEIRKPTMLSFQHSSIADLYFGAYINYPSLGEDIKEKLLNGRDEKDLEFYTFYRYLTTTDQIKAVMVVNYLSQYYRELEPLITKLIKEDKIQKSIAEGIDKIEDIYKVSNSLVIFANQLSEEEANKFSNYINIENLSTKIKMNKEWDLRNIGYIFLAISNMNKEMVMKLLDSVSSRINEEENLYQILSCFEIAALNKVTGKKLFDTINIDVISLKMNKAEKLYYIDNCLSWIAYANKNSANEIVSHLNPILRENLRKTNWA